MAWKVDFTLAAETDLDKIIEWYSPLGNDLANDFLSKLDDAISEMAKNPEHFQKIYKNFRKVNLTRFPYKIIYRVEKQIVLVIAIAHHKQRAYWRK